MKKQKQPLEIWKDIAGYEGYYQVSNYGRVKSLERWVPHVRRGKDFVREIILKQHVKRYCFVVLSKDGFTTNKSVHRLVAIAFIPNPDNLPQVNHNNPEGDKTDNRSWMLNWTDHDGNNNHAMENDLKPKGINHGRAKLTENDILRIREIGNSQTLEKTAELYNVQYACISKILARKTWKHL
jgi:hypothetical protein